MRSTWPLLIILGVFFVCSVNFHRGWETVAREQGIGNLIADYRAPLPAAPRLDGPAPQPLLATMHGTTFVAPQPPLANQTVAPAAQAPATPKIQSPVLADISSEPARPASEPKTHDNVSPAAPAVSVPVATAPPGTSPTPLASRPERKPDLSVPQSLQPAPATPSAQAWWPVPEELLVDLRRVADRNDAETSSWANRAIERVEALTRLNGPDERSHALLGELDQLASAELTTMLARLPEGSLSVDLRRAGYALTKRLDIWERVVTTDGAVAHAPQTDPQRLSLCLAEFEGHVDGDVQGAGWREYFMIDALKDLTKSVDATPERERRRLVQRILARFEHRNVSSSQEQFLHSEPIAKLRNELRAWGAEPLDSRDMLSHLEEFEKTTLPSDARLVALDYSNLKLADDENSADLAKLIDTHYRNANLRVSISSELINRMVPEQEPRSDYIRDMFMGYPTRGWSQTHTEVAIRLVPDSQRLRLMFEARGRVSSETNTHSGPVTVYTSAQSPFIAERELEIGLGGVHMSPLEVKAQTYPRLRAIKSEVDSVPILGPLVNRIAHNKNDESQYQAKSQAVRKIKTEVSSRIDDEMVPGVVALNQRVNDRVLTPLDSMALMPQLIEAQTTEDRMTMRVRVCSDEQLAGHSPRPRAPEDNLVNFQVHQSLLNNICEQLQWDGRTFSLDELQDEIAARVNAPLNFGNTRHEELSITFAEHDAIRVRCDDGRIELSLAIAELKAGRDHWKDFVIRVYYKPELNGGDAVLMRDGSVQLIGQRLGARGQLALRGVASKIFPPSKGFQVLPGKVHEQQGLANLGVTQFDIRDGWIGVALADVQRSVVNSPSASLR